MRTPTIIWKPSCVLPAHFFFHPRWACLTFEIITGTLEVRTERLCSHLGGSNHHEDHNDQNDKIHDISIYRERYM